jgi:thiamine-phosphate pyrophosphorylase
MWMRVYTAYLRRVMRDRECTVAAASPLLYHPVGMSVRRIIDANANRAREALRVMEEAARFLLDDRALTEALKTLRHDVTGMLAEGAFEGLDGVELSRDTPGDVGTGLSTEGEMTRATAGDAVIAAGKRLGEALRAIEEYSKTVDVDLAATARRLRYAGYDLELRLDRALGSGRARQWGVCVLLSSDVCAGRDWLEVAGAVADAEPDCIQLREKTLDDAELLARTERLLGRVRPGTAVVVNDRPDVALVAGAHGVHLGQTDLPCRRVREMAGRRLLVGVSTSTLAEAEAALRDGADYCGVGPMFATTTKRKDRIAGPAALRAYVAWGRLPHLAIGGITPENVDQLTAVGGRGIAVSAAVCGADDPAAVVRALKAALTAAAPA